MNKYKMNQNITSNFNKETDKDTLISLYSKIRPIFQNKDNLSWIDTAIYNIVRGKPVFNGVEKLRENNFNACVNDYFYKKDDHKGCRNSFTWNNNLVLTLNDNEELTEHVDILCHELLKAFYLNRKEILNNKGDK
ncbi:MAG: hypothetical protein CL760_01820 [Chloroflexi bacterium]|nr:hypothetical protein [Chloroflexota bacterium]|tara:strand:+ start:19120 stop:19524 length:405 start_codon:yes stop_codon:yes gene_type:complete